VETDAIQWLFLENRIALFVLVVFVEFWLLWAWARWRTRRTGRLALGGLIVGVLLLVLQTLVVTDREEIIVVCQGISRTIEDGDVDGFGEYIAVEFAVGSIDRDTLLASLTRILTQVRVEEPRLSGFDISVDGDQARADFQAGCRLVTSRFFEGRMLSRWELTFLRFGDRWRVIAIQPVPTPTFPYRTLPEVIGAR